MAQHPKERAANDKGWKCLLLCHKDCAQGQDEVDEEPHSPARCGEGAQELTLCTLQVKQDNAGKITRPFSSFTL